jgi:hypothetical protein
MADKRREEKRREEKRREEKGREGKGREGKGREGMDKETPRNTSNGKNSRCPDRESNLGPCNHNSEDLPFSTLALFLFNNIPLHSVLVQLCNAAA